MGGCYICFCSWRSGSHSYQCTGHFRWHCTVGAVHEQRVAAFPLWSLTVEVVLCVCVQCLDRKTWNGEASLHECYFLTRTQPFLSASSVNQPDISMRLRSKHFAPPTPPSPFSVVLHPALHLLYILIMCAVSANAGIWSSPACESAIVTSSITTIIIIKASMHKVF